MCVCVCTQHYKVRFKGKVEQSREWSSASIPTPWCSSYRKGSLRVTSTMVANFTFYLYSIYICVCVCIYYIYI